MAGPMRSAPAASTQAVPLTPVGAKLSRVGPIPARATKSPGDRPVRRIKRSCCRPARGSIANAAAAVATNSTAISVPSRRLFPVVQMDTGSGTTPQDSYTATTSVPRMPATQPMLYSV